MLYTDEQSSEWWYSRVLAMANDDMYVCSCVECVHR